MPTMIYPPEKQLPPAPPQIERLYLAVERVPPDAIAAAKRFADAIGPLLDIFRGWK